MKIIALLFTLCLGLSSTVLAQTEELKAAQANIDSKEYIQALDNLSKAKQAVSKLISDNLASVLPEKAGEFEMQKENEGMGGMGSQGVSVSKIYKKPVVKEANAEGDSDMMDPMMMMSEPQIMVTISTDMMMAGEVMNAHSMSENQMGQEGIKPLRVKGYRAIVRTQGGSGDDPMGGQQKRETVQIIVGGAFVSIESQGFEEFGDAEKLANQIDLEKLKGIIGE